MNNVNKSKHFVSGAALQTCSAAVGTLHSVSNSRSASSPLKATSKFSVEEEEKRLKEYEIIRRIGAGRFGEVYLVRQKTSNKIMCYKMVSYKGLLEKEKKQLVAEVNVMRQLNHENIVKYYDRIVDKTTQCLYIVMEYCNAGDLANTIHIAKKTFGGCDENIIIDIAKQMISALAYCHSTAIGSSGQRVLHRDLKPQNVFLCKNENNSNKFTAKIGDFGLSKHLGMLSFAHSCVGTPYYWPPELLSDGRKNYNDKSDMWALGCVIFEMAVGHSPFYYAQTLSQLKKAVKRGAHLPIKKLSHELNDLIRNLLHFNPNERPSALQCLGYSLFAEMKVSCAVGTNDKCSRSCGVDTRKEENEEELGDDRRNDGGGISYFPCANAKISKEREHAGLENVNKDMVVTNEEEAAREENSSSKVPGKRSTATSGCSLNHNNRKVSLSRNEKGNANNQVVASDSAGPRVESKDLYSHHNRYGIHHLEKFVYSNEAAFSNSVVEPKKKHVASKENINNSNVNNIIGDAQSASNFVFKTKYMQENLQQQSFIYELCPTQKEKEREEFQERQRHPQAEIAVGRGKQEKYNYATISPKKSVHNNNNNSNVQRHQNSDVYTKKQDIRSVSDMQKDLNAKYAQEYNEALQEKEKQKEEKLLLLQEQVYLSSQQKQKEQLLLEERRKSMQNEYEKKEMGNHFVKIQERQLQNLNEQLNHKISYQNVSHVLSNMDEVHNNTQQYNQMDKNPINNRNFHHESTKFNSYHLQDMEIQKKAEEEEEERQFIKNETNENSRFFFFNYSNSNNSKEFLSAVDSNKNKNSNEINYECNINKNISNSNNKIEFNHAKDSVETNYLLTPNKNYYFDKSKNYTCGEKQKYTSNFLSHNKNINTIVAGVPDTTNNNSTNNENLLRTNMSKNVNTNLISNVNAYAKSPKNSYNTFFPCNSTHKSNSITSNSYTYNSSILSMQSANYYYSSCSFFPSSLSPSSSPSSPAYSTNISSIKSNTSYDIFRSNMSNATATHYSYPMSRASTSVFTSAYSVSPSFPFPKQSPFFLGGPQEELENENNATSGRNNNAMHHHYLLLAVNQKFLGASSPCVSTGSSLFSNTLPSLISTPCIFSSSQLFVDSSHTSSCMNSNGSGNIQEKDRAFVSQNTLRCEDNKSDVNNLVDHQKFKHMSHVYKSKPFLFSSTPTSSFTAPSFNNNSPAQSSATPTTPVSSAFPSLQTYNFHHNNNLQSQDRLSMGNIERINIEMNKMKKRMSDDLSTYYLNFEERVENDRSSHVADTTPKYTTKSLYISKRNDNDTSNYPFCSSSRAVSQMQKKVEANNPKFPYPSFFNYMNNKQESDSEKKNPKVRNASPLHSTAVGSPLYQQNAFFDETDFYKNHVKHQKENSRDDSSQANLNNNPIYSYKVATPSPLLMSMRRKSSVGATKVGRKKNFGLSAPSKRNSEIQVMYHRTQSRTDGSREK